MSKTIVALYRDFQIAQEALAALVDAGFQREDISLIAQDETHGGQPGQMDPSQRTLEEEHSHASEAKSDAAAGAGAGAVIGGLAGLVMGLSALAIPGIGPLVAAGPLATALAGAGLGTVTGGIIGALADGGVPEDEAEAYVEGIERGGTLVAVRTADERANEARDLLRRFGPEDIHKEEGQERERIAGAGMEFGAGPEAAGAAPGRTQRAGMMDTGLENPEMDSGWDFSRAEDEDMANPGHEFRMHDEGIQGKEHHMDDRDLSSMGGEGGEGAGGGRDWTQGRDMGGGEEGLSMRAHGQDLEGQDDDLYRGIAGTQHPMAGRGRSPEGGRDYESFLPEYQNHFNMLYADRGEGFDHYEPAYHYGYDLARMERYQDSHWTEIEPQASEEWERVFPDRPWNESREAVRHAWERAAGTQTPRASGQAGRSRFEGYGSSPDQGYEKPNY